MPRLASVGLYVRDLARTVDFYRDALGFEVRRDFGTYLLLAGDDPASSLIVSTLPEGRDADDVGRSVMKLVFFADDSAACLARIVAAGGELVTPATAREAVPYVIGFGRDPDGHLLEIIADSSTGS